MKTLNSGPDQREVHLAFSQGHKETETLIGCCLCPALQQEKLLMLTQPKSYHFCTMKDRTSHNRKVWIQLQPSCGTFLKT